MTETTETSPSEPACETRVSLLRRLAALAYDLLLLLAVMALFTLVVIALRGGRPVEPGTWWFELCLAAITALFFTWFWAHGGQTLGMRAWGLRVVGRDGGPPGWKRALARYFAAIVSAAPLGLGFWWGLIDRDGSTWHDRWCGTKVVRVRRR